MIKTKNDLSAHILIVDDEPLIRKILSKYLKGKGYSVDCANNGHEAMEKLKSSEYDLVLTDLRMPHMGGRELLTTMSDLYPDMPKIVLTGYGTNDDIILALKTGAYDFLSKPITDFNILQHSIERAIERKRLNEERNRYVEQLKQINDIISMLNSGKNTEEIFNTLNVMLRKNIPFNKLALSTIDKSLQKVTNKLIASDRDVLHGVNESFELNESSALEEAYNNKKVLNILDLASYNAKHKNAISTQYLLQEGMSSALILPLIVNDITRGFLIFASTEKKSFNNDHIAFLISIGGQIALSIQRGELLYEIEQHNKNLEHLVDLRTKEVIKIQKTTIFALSKLAETRDPETGGHLERIRNYSVFLAQLLKYSGHPEITNQYLRDLYDSSILHDIGKVGIPDGILLKDGFLTDYETDVMKKHAEIGYKALKSSSVDLGDDSFLNMAMDITLYHHERWDGKGYPANLQGTDIPLAARIVAIADVYDALTSKRPYKEAYDHEKALEIMYQEPFKFDPDLFEIFCQNAHEFNNIRKKINNNR